MVENETFPSPLCLPPTLDAPCTSGSSSLSMSSRISPSSSVPRLSDSSAAPPARATLLSRPSSARRHAVSSASPSYCAFSKRAAASSGPSLLLAQVPTACSQWAAPRAHSRAKRSSGSSVPAKRPSMTERRSSRALHTSTTMSSCGPSSCTVSSRARIATPFAPSCTTTTHFSCFLLEGRAMARQ